jgi:hypothetical protein
MVNLSMSVARWCPVPCVLGSSTLLRNLGFAAYHCGIILINFSAGGRGLFGKVRNKMLDLRTKNWWTDDRLRFKSCIHRFLSHDCTEYYQSLPSIETSAVHISINEIKCSEKAVSQLWLLIRSFAGSKLGAFKNPAARLVIHSPTTLVLFHVSTHSWPTWLLLAYSTHS